MKTEEVIENTQAFIEAMCSPARADDLNRFLDGIGTDNYFTAPASSRESYHSCYPGGLAEHNLNVLENLVKLNASFKLGFTDEQICVVSLLHDIGKAVNTNFTPFYKVSEEKWKQNRGEKYEHDYGKVYLPTHQRSVWLCQALDFTLSIDEYQAILLNDGQYLQENKGYANKECALAKALHIADTLACMAETKVESPQGN